MFTPTRIADVCIQIFTFTDVEGAHKLTNSHGSERAGHHRLSGWRPLIVGMIHGLAGSAGLTLLVLTEVVRGGSRLLGIGYLMVFGIGSTTECFAMSMLISLPFAFTARRFERVNGSVRLLTALFSVAFGIYYVWATIRSR